MVSLIKQEPRASALLSVDESVQWSRPLRHWHRNSILALENKLVPFIRQWHLDFGITSKVDEIRVHGLPIDEALDRDDLVSRWSLLGGAQGNLWWAIKPRKFGQDSPLAAKVVLEKAFFGEVATTSSTAPMTSDVVETAWGHFWEGLLAKLFVEATPMAPGLTPHLSALPPSLHHPWSGTICLQVDWCEQTLIIVLDGNLAAAHLPSRTQASDSKALGLPSLTSVVDAISKQKIALRVELEPFQIELGSLMSLGIGDVIRTSHRFDKNMVLSVSSSPDVTLCAVFLGQKSGHKAIELVLERPGAKLN